VIVDGRSGLTGRKLFKSIIRHGLKDTFSFRGGASARIPGAGDRFTVRLGGAYDTRAADQIWERVDFDSAARTTLAVGASAEISRFTVDLGFAAILEGDRTVENACNPTASARGCDGTNTETPVRERDAPDPVQPLAGPFNQTQSPFNAGTYESGYLMFAVGVRAAF
jgi:long-subunit fatty acid transport protein